MEKREAFLTCNVAVSWNQNVRAWEFPFELLGVQGWVHAWEFPFELLGVQGWVHAWEFPFELLGVQG